MTIDVCRCSHKRDVHGLDRKKRPTCFGASMCGCRQFREPSPDPAADHWRRIPEHLRTEDWHDYMQQKGETS